MEIICNQQLLLGAINTVLKAVSSKTSYPILECILIETDNDDIRLTANDNDFCIETVIEGTVNRAGKIALNARMLSDLVCTTVGVILGAPAGIGTVITALFMGPLISFFRRTVSEPWLHRGTGGATT